MASPRDQQILIRLLLSCPHRTNMYLAGRDLTSYLIINHYAYDLRIWISQRRHIVTLAAGQRIWEYA
jgi:hypothetical protein